MIEPDDDALHEISDGSRLRDMIAVTNKDLVCLVSAVLTIDHSQERDGSFFRWWSAWLRANHHMYQEEGDV